MTNKKNEHILYICSEEINKIKYFEKIALRASKAKQLAESAGLLAIPGTDWKWALKQLRAPNPTGAYQSVEDLLLKGKDLNTAKWKVQGKLYGSPQNQHRAETSLKAYNKKLVGNGTELGTVNRKTNSGDDAIIFLQGKAGAFELPFSPDDVPITHTHPSGGRIVNLNELKKFREQLKQEGYRRELRSLIYDRDSALNKNLNARPSGISIAYDPTNKQKRQLLNEMFSDVRGTTREMRNSVDFTDPTSFIDSIEKLKNTTGWGADIISHAGTKNFSIIGAESTGYHKISPKHPKSVRSIYFKGGLDNY